MKREKRLEVRLGQYENVELLGTLLILLIRYKMRKIFLSRLKCKKTINYYSAREPLYPINIFVFLKLNLSCMPEQRNLT